jgi:hypothetical protein
VPTFNNRTLVPHIEVLVTDTVIKQFQQDGTFMITSDDKADATLTGETGCRRAQFVGMCWPRQNLASR